MQKEEWARGSVNEIEHAAICDYCDQNIRGIRFKCMNCLDFDLCEECEKSKYVQLKGHNQAHILLKLYYPIEKIQTTHQQVIFKQVTTPVSRVSSVSCSYDVDKLHRGVICDLCETSIIGVRYKCLHCRTEEGFDVCEKCETTKLHLHPHDHIFAKIPVPIIDSQVLWNHYYRYSFPNNENSNSDTMIENNNLSIRSHNNQRVEADGESQLMIRLRLAKMEDIQRIIELEQQVFASPYELNCFKQLVYLNWQRNRNTMLIVAIINANIVGYILTSKKEHKQSLLIMSLAIDKAYHGKGVGRELLNFVIQHTSVNHPNITTIYLQASALNIAAQRLYTKMGFKTDEYLFQYYSNGEDALKMELKIER